ncbi:Hypothetical predicted protein [Marmota monax]|uniref:Uncharacterized protein n=1 Tax=Marmota monax TaxID=9995 RepID=A0A5E4B4D2_MARMO|nr:Hypothetical predicted protein [Marmota monax]
MKKDSRKRTYDHLPDVEMSYHQFQKPSLLSFVEMMIPDPTPSTRPHTPVCASLQPTTTEDTGPPSSGRPGPVSRVQRACEAGLHRAPNQNVSWVQPAERKDNW